MLTEAARADDIDAVRDAFLRIPHQIRGVSRVEWGVNDSPEALSAGFTHCVLMTFENERARQRYLPHPAHRALQARLRPVLQQIMVLDFTPQPETTTVSTPRYITVFHRFILIAAIYQR
jgi:hypothetical protein